MEKELGLLAVGAKKPMSYMQHQIILHIRVRPAFQKRLGC